MYAIRSYYAIDDMENTIENLKQQLEKVQSFQESQQKYIQIMN